MKIHTLSKFHANADETKEYILNADRVGDTPLEEFYLTIGNNAQVNIEAYIDDETVIQNPSALNLGVMDFVDNIFEKGCYLITTTPYTKMKLTFVDEADVIVKIVY